jgi:hypothetical protein
MVNSKNKSFFPSYTFGNADVPKISYINYNKKVPTSQIVRFGTYPFIKLLVGQNLQMGMVSY